MRFQSRIRIHTLKRGIHISEYIPAYHLKDTRFPIKPKREFPFWIQHSSRFVYPFHQEVELKPVRKFELIFKKSKPNSIKKQGKQTENKYQNFIALPKNDKTLIMKCVLNYHQKGDSKPFYMAFDKLEIRDILQLQSELKIPKTRKYYSSLLYKYRNEASMENLQEMQRILEKIRFECFSKPSLSEILLVLETTMILKQDPQDLFKLVLTEYQPSVSFFLLFIEYFRTGGIDLINTCHNYHMLSSTAIQKKILGTMHSDVLSKSLEFISILKRMNIRVSEETLNHALSLYTDPIEAVEFIKINQFKIYSQNIRRLLQLKADKLVSTELWPMSTKNKRMISLFIKYCSSANDFHTLQAISSLISEKEMFIELLDGLIGIDSPSETLRVWQLSGLQKHGKSWRWLLLSINSRNSMTVFTDLVTQLLLHGPGIPDDLSDILFELLERIGETDLEKQQLLLQHVNEMALYHQDMDNIF
ncbi:hypothetical protein HDV01_007710 [Terramyces sp. JEL0728]|nr:hypothetical protein HDV01_007710 [Terramyces sp. JEL0728]